ncbi:MAG: hypothetical protein FWC40_01820 [Proteobacteria bacterium]|nr:hypothetical protein [Pseudomonadota bacterium]
MKPSRVFLCAALASAGLIMPGQAFGDTSSAGTVLILDDEDTASAKVLELDIVEVHAKGIAAQPSSKPLFAQTFGRPQALSINDLLESTPNVYGDVSSKGTRQVIVRGFEMRQLSVRFAGIPLDTGYDGMTGLDAIPANWIGAGQIRFADAGPTDATGMGGGIEFTPIAPSLLEAALEINLTGAVGALMHGMQHGPWSWVATAGGNYSEGFRLSRSFTPTAQEDGGLRDASDKRGVNAFGSLSRKLGNWGEWKFLAGHTQAPRGVPTGIDTENYRYWRFTKWHITLVSTELSFASRCLFGQAQVWFVNQGNTLRAFDNADRSTQTLPAASTSVWRDDDYGFQIDLSTMTWDLGAAGFLDAQLRTEMRYQQHEAVTDTFHPVTNTVADSSRLMFDIRPGVTWQLRHNLRLFASGHATGNVELGSHNNAKTTEFRMQSLYNGGFSFGTDYAFSPKLGFGLRVARRLRMPTLKEQFDRLPNSASVQIPLNAEVSWNVSGEIRWRPFSKMSLSVTGYNHEVRDIIAIRTIDGIRQAYNIAEARLAGLDTTLLLGSWYGLSLETAYGYLYAYDLSADHVLNDRPAHNLRAILSYSPLPSLTLSLTGQYESKRRTEVQRLSNPVWLGAIFLLDAEVAWQHESFSAYIRASNLLDYNYARTFGYPEPGFNLTVGARIHL